MPAETAKLEEMDTSELKDHYERLSHELQRREQEDRIRKAQEVERIAQAMGFVSLAEAARTLSSLNKTDRSRITYVHPTDSSLTWSGRGRKPHWVRDFVNEGGHLEDIVVAGMQGEDGEEA